MYKVGYHVLPSLNIRLMGLRSVLPCLRFSFCFHLDVCVLCWLGRALAVLMEYEVVFDYLNYMGGAGRWKIL